MYALFVIVFYTVNNDHIIKIVHLNRYICYGNMLIKFNSNTAQRQERNTIKNTINTK